MNRDEVLAFMRALPYWVEASVGPSGEPQAAVVGVVVSDRLELFFDTLATSRKAGNLRRDRRIALVAWQREATVQIEAAADEPAGADLARLKALYFERFPDGRERERWAGITYVRARPTWIRYSDYSGAEPRIGAARRSWSWDAAEATTPPT